MLSQLEYIGFNWYCSQSLDCYIFNEQRVVFNIFRKTQIYKGNISAVTVTEPKPKATVFVRTVENQNQGFLEPSEYDFDVWRLC